MVMNMTMSEGYEAHRWHLSDSFVAAGPHCSTRVGRLRSRYQPFKPAGVMNRDPGLGLGTTYAHVSNCLTGRGNRVRSNGTTHNATALRGRSMKQNGKVELVTCLRAAQLCNDRAGTDRFGDQ